jgi:hypothetical protein
VFGINTVLANSVEQKEQALLSSGGSLAGFHPPNLHQAPPLKDTHNLVTPLYNAAPAPMGVAYYGLSNTTGTIQGTTVNTTSLLGTWNTTDPLGTAAEVFDTSSGNAAGSFGAQLNTVLVNTTLHGQTSFGPAGNVNVGPTGCQAWNLAENNLNSTTCPNVFWLQLYIEYSEASHSLTISNEIWNFSNPTGDWSGTGTNTIDGFGSVESAEVYQGPSSGTITIPYPYTFSLALYMNYTQGPCHTDSVAGTGIASCPAAYGTTYPLNELFMNYTVRSGSGARLCPTSIPSGRLCGEDDDVFFNSLAPGATHGVPALGPHGRIGSATIQANGTQYDPIGLTNDFEFDYGIGSDDGATNLIFYQHGIVGLDYCQNANAVQAPTGGIKCGTYSPPPAAEDFGGETGETSTGEMAYWAPQGAAAINPHTGLGPTLLPGASSPITYLDTGPALLTGLWNMTGSTYTGSAPYPAFTGGEPLSYANIAPANAWVGIAQDISPGINVASQYYYQVAPTFGYFSYWKGSGGDLCATPTAIGCSGVGGTTQLGANLWLPAGSYTIEVLLSGYAPYVGQVNLNTPQAPSITLTPSYATGAYTLDWAFSNNDLANLTVSGSNTVPTGAGTSGSPYMISAGTPDVGTVNGVVIGEPGSLSWLFSNLNDYLFTQWIGAYINSTTATTQFNPAPSFLEAYPSWQISAIQNANWFLPSTDGFQYILVNTQNLAVIGATDLFTWAESEATTIYSVVVNNGANDLIADNTFNTTNHGLDFTGGGTTDTSTINGAPVTFLYDSHTRNVVWGNTFNPDPLQAPYAGFETFTAQDQLTLGEAFDRVAANTFAAYSSTVNSTANAGATDTTYWNVTCVAGYSPLSQETYPGTGPTGVCQPLSNSESLDGYTMTGSADGASYQGGNFWAGYGNFANAYGNIPYKARLTSPTGTAEIAATTHPYWGDMAPLITYPVSELTFQESGLPSSSTTTEFSMHITNSTSHYSWLNSTATNGVTTPGCAGSTVCLNFYVPFGTYTYYATPPTGYGMNPDVGSVSFTSASTLVMLTFAAGFLVTFTQSGLPASTRWYVNTTGQLSISGTTATLTQTLPSGSYTYTASSVNGQYAWSPSPGFTVSGAPLGVTVTFTHNPTVSVTPVGPLSVDVGQSVTLTATITYSGPATTPVEWYSNTTPTCNQGSTDTGTSGGSLNPSTASTGATWYCAVVSDSEVPTWHSASNAVEVAVGGDPTVSVAPTGPLSYDVGQSASTLTATVTYSGPNTASVEWYSSSSSACSASSTDTGVSGLTFTPSTASTGTTWYCAVVSDSGVPSYSSPSNPVEVTVYADPTVSVAPAGPFSYDVGQTASGLTATVTYSGPNTASVEWYSSSSSSCSVSSTNTGVSGLSFTPSTASSGTTWYCAVVSDSGVASYSSASNAVEVTVTTGPTVSVSPAGPFTYDADQAATTLTATVSYTGPNTVSVEWYSSLTSACSSGSTDTGVSGTSFTPSTAASGTTYYCAVVSDSGVPGYTSASNAVEVTVVPYSVSFSESGLPSGLTWKVTVNGVSEHLTTNGHIDTLTFSGLVDGTYSYVITPTSGWHEKTLPYSGSVTVNGASVTEPTLIYKQVTYSVTFKESGLPSGLTWTVTVNGVSQHLTTDGNTDHLTWTGIPNGTYAYSVTGNAGWHEATLPYNGNVVVSGANVLEPIMHYKLWTYTLTFSESGLPSGLVWKVTVNGVMEHLLTNGGTDSLSWTLGNGTYSYSITAIHGWTQSTMPSSGNVAVAGADVTEPTLVYT